MKESLIDDISGDLLFVSDEIIDSFVEQKPTPIVMQLANEGNERILGRMPSRDCRDSSSGIFLSEKIYTYIFYNKINEMKSKEHRGDGTKVKSKGQR